MMDGFMTLNKIYGSNSISQTQNNQYLVQDTLSYAMEPCFTSWEAFFLDYMYWILQHKLGLFFLQKTLFIIPLVDKNMPA